MKYRRVDTGKIVNVSPGYVAAFPAGTYVLADEPVEQLEDEFDIFVEITEPTPNESEQD